MIRVRFDVLTLFPEMYPGYLGQSLLRRAIDRGLVDVQLHNIRDWTKDKHGMVDDRPYGGGPGMVLKVEPTVACVEAVQEMGETPGHLVVLTPSGQRLDQPLVEKLSQQQRLLFLCGRYEGFDQRVIDILRPEEISIGDYVLNGGEVASMVLIDAVVRLIPEVLGDERSSQEDSFSGTDRLLEHAHYTRPREFRGHQVPEVLLSGNHPEISRWRHEQSLRRTRQHRTDLSDEV